MSGFQNDDLYQSEQSQLSAAQGTNAVASLQAGHPFSLLLADDERQRAAALETLMDTIADPGTRFARATNPLRARLTLERLLIQVIQGGGEALMADPAALIRKIAERRNDETRVVLIIEQSETLHPEVLKFFGATAAYFPDAIPRLQVLFVGGPEFRQMLDDPDAGLDESTAQLEQYRPKEAEPNFGVPPPEVREVLPQRPLPFQDTSLRSQIKAVWGGGLLVRFTIIFATLVGTAAVSFAVMIAVTAPPDVGQLDTSTALSEMPEPAANDPDPPVLQPGAPADEATGKLRQEFENYLIASGKDLTNATQVQKRVLLQEFLLWRARTTGQKASE